ncbi:hypothetical protein ACIHCM_16660 [Streptomyces sp. NPDC052023]|uniref:hypothetical protein n=1 Tax=Streptomyces sp. NPDC052023 TaxID=3365681 RepID=UPI0037D78448
METQIGPVLLDIFEAPLSRSRPVRSALRDEEIADGAEGDVMVVDNILTAHGREPFRGERRIVVAMGDPVNVRDCLPTVDAEARFV